MAELVLKNYLLVRNVISSLDILLAFLIIFSSYYIADISFGKAALFFGFSMLFLTTLLKVFQKW